MKKQEPNIRFYYDLGKMPIKKPWGTVTIIGGFLYAIFYVYVFLNEPNDSRSYFSLMIGLVMSAFWILIGSGWMYPRGKFYLKITDEAILYKIPGKKRQEFLIKELRDVGIYPGYIHFDTQDGMRTMLDFPMLPYEAVRSFKEALKEIKLNDKPIQ